MASTSKSYDPSPERERFERLNRNKPVGSERAASSDDEDSSDDEVGGGAPLHYAAASPVVKTPPSLTRAQRLEALRTNGGTVPFPQTPQRRPRVLEPTNYMAPVDNDDDVFVSPKSIKERRSEQASSASGAIARLDVPLANTQADHALRPSDSNLSARHQINGVDAQNLYPPTACVFVANLPEPKDDVSLEAALYREFLKYGKCWVKIRRDAHHMPFAFIQFTSDEEAQEALVKGKGALIHGRACRTEPVKANRTFVIQKKNGAPISIEEAEEALLPFGSLSKIEQLHTDLRTSLGYPPTILVEFSMFDATRDLHSAFRSDNNYTVLAFDLKKNCVYQRNNGDEAFLAACERDRRSIFVGDLPSSTSQFDLEELFSECGSIVKINVIQRTPNYHQQGAHQSYMTSQASPGQIKTMAFVEFTQPDMAELAISMFHATTFRNAVLRVERKSVKDRGNPLPRHNRAPPMQLVRPMPSTEDPAATPARNSSGAFIRTGTASASRVQQAPPPVMATPARGRAHSRAAVYHQQMTTPTAAAPAPPAAAAHPPAQAMGPPPAGPIFGSWTYNHPVSPYGPTSPYAPQPPQGWDVTGGAPAAAAYGGAVMPVTPSATPFMAASPYTYYYNNWAGMSPYDANAHYPGAYSFQSPGPMMNTGMNGPIRVPGGMEQHGVEATPTRARGPSSAAPPQQQHQHQHNGNEGNVV